jgi:hypothetical protein
MPLDSLRCLVLLGFECTRVLLSCHGEVINSLQYDNAPNAKLTCGRKIPSTVSTIHHVDASTLASLQIVWLR